VDVDVAHRDDKFQQRGLIDELVEKYDVVLDPKLAQPRVIRLSR